MTTTQFVSKFDKNKECANQGYKAERTFKDILISEGFDVRDASKEEQINHIDFLASKDNKIIKYDVKARKRINRQDSNYQDSFVWIELLNVNGNEGWLNGHSDYIVFERSVDFVVVNRKKLADFVLLHCNLNKKVKYADEALYANYQRFGRNDCLTLIRNEDIENLASKIYPKVIDTQQNLS